MNPAIRKKEKNETVLSTGGELHKGYNEKNPGQPQGAFTAESVSKKPTKDIDKKAYKK